MTAFTVVSSKRFSISGTWPCASSRSDVTFGCCSCSPTAVVPARCSALALPVAIAAGSYVGCLLRSIASVLLPRGTAEGGIRALAALMMPPLSCVSLLACIPRASGVSSRAFCRLIPATLSVQCACVQTPGLASGAVECPQAPPPVCRYDDTCKIRVPDHVYNSRAVTFALLPLLRPRRARPRSCPRCHPRPRSHLRYYSRFHPRFNFAFVRSPPP